MVTDVADNNLDQVSSAGVLNLQSKAAQLAAPSHQELHAA